MVNDGLVNPGWTFRGLTTPAAFTMGAGSWGVPFTFKQVRFITGVRLGCGWCVHGACVTDWVPWLPLVPHPHRVGERHHEWS